MGRAAVSILICFFHSDTVSSHQAPIALMLLTRANRFMALQRLCVQMLWANVDKTFVGCTRSDGACTLRTQHMDIAIAILTLPYSRARHPWTCITHSLGSQGALVWVRTSSLKCVKRCGSWDRHCLAEKIQIKTQDVMRCIPLRPPARPPARPPVRASWGARLKLPIDRLRRLVYTECGAGGLIVCLIAHTVCTLVGLAIIRRTI